MASLTYQHTCALCGSDCKKNGKTPGGKVRWRCKECGASSSVSQPSRRQAWWEQLFVDWLLDKDAPKHHGVSDRSFRRNTSHMWKIHPRWPVTGVVEDVIVLDATYISGRALLIMRNREHVIAWRWAKTENSLVWGELMDMIPTPRLVVTDGGSGIVKALKAHWPDARVQRCLFHIYRNIRSRVTLRPQTQAGKDILALGKVIKRKLASPEEAIAFQEEFNRLYEIHKDFLNEKTYSTSNGSRTWEWTHERTRSAWRLLAQRIREDNVFTYLEPSLTSVINGPLPHTSNDVEGGINSYLKTLLRTHRGMPPAHQRILAEHYLASRLENPPTITQIKAEHQKLQEKLRQLTPKQTEGAPPEYDNKFIWQEIR